MPAAILLAAALALAGCGPGRPLSTTPPPGSTPPELGFPAGRYSSVQTYGDPPVFTIAYRVAGDTIAVGIKAKTNGWVAVALGEAVHVQSDVWIGYVTADGQAIILDSDNASKAGNHALDSTRGGADDLFDISGSESNGITTLEFKRRLNTGESLDIALAPGNNQFTWAFGATDSLTSIHIRIGFGTITITP